MDQERNYKSAYMNNRKTPINPADAAKPLMGGASSRRRIGYIDAMKGFGILCVVLGHVAQGNLLSGKFGEAEGLLHCMYNGAYCFHMPFFFMISGYVYFRAYFDNALQPKYKKVWTQLGNLLCVYVLFSVLYGGFRILFSGYANGETTPLELLLIGVKPIMQFWYLYTLMALYLIYLIPGIVKWKSAWMLLVGALLSLCSGYAAKLLNGLFSLRDILYHGLFFATGIMLAREDAWTKRPAVFASAGVVGVILFAAFRGDMVVIDTMLPIKLTIALGISLGLWKAFEQIPLLGENRFLQYCGRLSLEIYVLHGFFTAGNRTLLPLLGITNAYAGIVLNCVISVIVPLLAVWICRKVGLHDLFFRPASFIQGFRRK